MEHRDGGIRSSDETAIKAVEQRDSVYRNFETWSTEKREESMNKGKSYEISKHRVIEAFKLVKANKGVHEWTMKVLNSTKRT